jgi:hypothetical protein
MDLPALSVQRLSVNSPRKILIHQIDMGKKKGYQISSGSSSISQETTACACN